MKTIGLLQVRNEGHILPYTLPPLAQICDHIIVADQNSTDDTRTIIKKCKNAILIDNNEPPPPKGKFDSARQLLLEAARNFDGNNILLATDADEVIAPPSSHPLKEMIFEHYQPGQGFEMRWIQLYKNTHSYLPISRDRFHVPWMRCAFYDDRRPIVTVNRFAHGGRFPVGKVKNHYVLDYRLVHLRWLSFNKSLWQQVWYMMKEWQHNAFSASSVAHINKFYHSTNYVPSTAQTKPVPATWLDGISLPSNHLDDITDWRKNEVMELFNQYGMAHFEPLNIWFLQPLRHMFVEAHGRNPMPQTVPFSLSTWWRPYRLQIREGYHQLVTGKRCQQ